MWIFKGHGTHWHKAVVTKRRDGSASTITPNIVPQQGDSISVRVKAHADPDRSIDQTIIDAYHVG